MKHQIFSITIAFVIAFGVVSIARTVMPKVEGFIMPSTKVTRLGMEQLTGDSYKVWGTFDKLRGCDLIRMESRAEDSAGVDIPIIMTVRQTVDLYPESESLPFGPWTFRVVDFATRVHVTVYTTHACHGAWNTRTRFADFDLDFTLDRRGE